MPANVAVTWNEPYDGGSPIIDYEVAAAPGDTRVTAQTITAPTRTATFMSVPDGLYFFRVRARNSIGHGAWSDGTMVKINVTDIVAVYDFDDRLVSIGDIEGTGTLTEMKNIRLPSNRVSTQQSGNDICFVGNNQLATTYYQGSVVSIFSVAGGDGTQATEIKNVPYPAGVNITWPYGITRISDTVIALLDHTADVVSIFSIAGSSGVVPVEMKRIPTPMGRDQIQEITYIGNNQIAAYDAGDGVISIFSIAGSSGVQAQEIKNVPLPANRTNIAGGITYLGNDMVAMTFTSYGDIVSIFSIAGNSGVRAVESRFKSLSSGRDNPTGIAFLSNIHGF